MCGRYSLGATAGDLQLRFGLAGDRPETEPRWNIAPSQLAPVIVQNGTRHATAMRWGLTPGWARESTPRYSTINARAETVADKPSFRGPLRERRCLVPATGFYEWEALEGAPKRGARRPWHIRLAGGDLFAFAGLYDIWRGPDGAALASYTIITTTANGLVAPLHERMPVILPRELEAAWLDPAERDTERLLALLRPYPAEAMVRYPAPPAVNSAAHDGPELALPAGGVLLGAARN
jgi:putative SOS response-associated peptidase YedK